MSRVDIVSLGEPLYEFSALPGQERRWLQGFGGDTSNCAIAAGRQGAKVAYVTRLGQDAFGEQFLALWKQEGLDVSGVGIDPDAHTAVYFI
ncbi:MAG TPA: PfkB family carbohydrate kinase, partial [Burkholderiales bacterium]|nr:PfkB family carbohydrate kinase [Burkholderiales bacterium]